jgi:cytochrome c oxidase cbb3-type subunit 3
VALHGQDVVERGKAQFTKTCSFCHGPDATGGAEGPNLIRSGVVRHDVNGNLIGNVIREGRPAKGMPPIPLTDAQISDVVAYLHHRVTETDIRSPRKPKGYSLSLLLTGNAEKGREYFEEYCRSCHSPSGDLKGIATRMEPADLQGTFLYPENVAKTATVTDSQGHHTTGTLLYQDQFTVAIRDGNDRYHSWPADHVRIEVHDPVAAHERLLATYTEADMHNVFAYLETLK